MRGKWLIATAITALLLGGIGSAGAARLLSGKDIRDRSLKGHDIAKNSIYSSNLSAGLRKAVFSQQSQSLSPGQKGANGTNGAQGAKGDTGAQGAKGDTGAQGQTGSSGADGAPGAATLVTPSQNFTGGTNDVGTKWADDQFDCNAGNGTGSQGFQNGNTLFPNQEPPLQTGFYGFDNTAPNATDTEYVLHDNEFDGAKISDLQEFRYSEIFTGGAPNDAVYVQIKIDQDGRPDTNDLTTLFFIPANQNGVNNSPKQGAVKDGVWQSWNVLIGTFSPNGDNNNQITWDQFKAAHKDATFRQSGGEGAIRIVAGCGQNTGSGNYKAATDNVALTVGSESHKILYDFEAS
jgi:hypothetical protein